MEKQDDLVDTDLAEESKAQPVQTNDEEEKSDTTMINTSASLKENSKDNRPN